MTVRASLIRVAAGFIVALAAATATAGEINEVDGTAIKGYDPVAYFTDHTAVAGSDQFTAEYHGATFKFASAAHRDAFVADAEKYAPQFGGFCAYGTAAGKKADIDPDAFTIVDGKLYLNHSRETMTKWRQDVPGYIGKATQAWPSVSQSTEVIR
jgi:hypothetical protein